MRNNKIYQNGTQVLDANAEYKRAKELLIQAGMLRKMGNFGPYYPDKDKRYFTKLETLVLDGIEFTIIESEVMSFSLGSMSMSEPYMQKEAWFQPVKTA